MIYLVDVELEGVSYYFDGFEFVSEPQLWIDYFLHIPFWNYAITYKLLSLELFIVLHLFFSFLI